MMSVAALEGDQAPRRDEDWQADAIALKLNCIETD
jgi:hypothetical protein